MRKTSNVGTTRYVWDGDDLALELDGAGNLLREYAYYPGVDQPHSVRRASDGAVFRYTQEVPGHVSGLVAAGNTVVNTYTYTPFGEPLNTSEQVYQPLRYAAREYDEETGLYYVRARYYDPEQGRFVSQDPIGLTGGINSYAYVGNDPVNLTDPSGLKCTVFKIVQTTHYSDGTKKFRTLGYGVECSDDPDGQSGGGIPRGMRFDRCHVARFLIDLIDAMRSDPGSFRPDYPPAWDFKAYDQSRHEGQLLDHYQVGDQWLRSDQFGNFAAAYAGQRVFGFLGYVAVRRGGIAYARQKDSTEDRWDMESAPMIHAGSTRALQEIGQSSHLVNRLPRNVTPLTSLTGCSDK